MINLRQTWGKDRGLKHIFLVKVLFEYVAQVLSESPLSCGALNDLVCAIKECEYR